jgi:electron transport complex protein RnfC
MRLPGILGGARLRAATSPRVTLPIRDCPLPATLIVPLAQPGGASARALVAPGDSVRRGQRIGDARGTLGSDVFAPAAGRVVSVEPRRLPTADASTCDCVILQTERVGAAATSVDAGRVCVDPDAPSLRRLLQDVIGSDRHGASAALGAPGDPEPALLILDAVDREPWLQCDAAVVHEHADQVMAGAALLQRALEAGRVMLALDGTRAAAIDAARDAIARSDTAIEVAVVASAIAAEDTTALVRRVAGVELAAGARPREHGIAVLDVAGSESPATRIVTVAGPGVARPGNYRVAIGTPLAHLLAAAGCKRHAAPSIVTDASLHASPGHEEQPILASSRGVLVLEVAQRRAPVAESPCIDCGACAPRCPQRLQPQRLLARLQAGQFEGARRDGVLDCIDCGACDAVCPSHIALASRFAAARTELRLREQRVAVADVARVRFQARNARLAREQAERTALDAARRDTAATSDAVQAALERARARRREPRGGGS